MKRFIYVRAEAPKGDLSLISFAHRFITAADADKAYNKGAKLYDARPSKWVREHGFVPLNDYVIPLTEKFKCA